MIICFGGLWGGFRGIMFIYSFPVSLTFFTRSREPSRTFTSNSFTAKHVDSIKTSCKLFHPVRCWLTTFYGYNFFSFMLHVCYQAAECFFFAQHVTKCKILHHSVEKEAQTTFLTPPSPMLKQCGVKWFAAKTFTHFSARTSAFLLCSLEM